MLDCRIKGYSVAVAVVDKGGNVQAVFRDRYAGPHTTETAIRKAWTSNSFRQTTADLAENLKKGLIPSQVLHNPGAFLVGGGIQIEAQGNVLWCRRFRGTPGQIGKRQYRRFMRASRH